MTASWSDLKKAVKTVSAEPNVFDAACAVVFTSPSGRQLMAMLRARHIEAVLPGTPDDRALAYDHAKRQLVHELEDATARGLAALKKDKTA